MTSNLEIDAGCAAGPSPQWVIRVSVDKWDIGRKRDVGGAKSLNFSSTTGRNSA